MDVADEPVPRQERLVLLRSVRGIGPDAGAGVRGVEQALAQQPPVVPAGVRNLPAADQSIPSVDARMGLVSKGRDRNVQHRAIPIAPGLARLDRPAGVHVFLARLRRLIRPDFMGAPARLRGLLLVPGVALLGSRHQGAVDDLARHRDVPGRTNGGVEPTEQIVDGARPGQALAEHPDRLRVRHPVVQPEAKKPHERQPVVDQELRLVVAETILRLDHQDFEHQDRVVRRPPALRTVRIVKRRFQIRPEDLEIHHCRIRLKLVANVAQPLQAFLNVKKPGLRRHDRLQHAHQRIESQPP